MPIRPRGRAIHRPVVPVARHIGGVAVEGIVGDETGCEVCPSSGDQTEQEQAHRK